MTMAAPFVVQPRLTAITLTFRNKSFIADDVLPRVPVDSSLFKYSQFTTADGYTIPDTRVGRKSAPGQIDWTATETTATTFDYGLDDAIPVVDIQNAQAAQRAQGLMPIDPQSRSTMLLTDLVALDRENRVANGANGVFVNGNYPAANRATLSGTSQWSDYTNSNPLTALMQALDVPLVRPNVLVLGQQTWTQLRGHPKITAAAFPSGGNAVGGGTVLQRQALAALLEIDEVIVGSAWYNSAKPGQTFNATRLWGKHASLLYRNRSPMSTTNDVTFGFTAQWGDRIAGTIANDPSIGLRGGVRVRVGESVAEVIAASNCGYFFQNAVA